MDRRIAGERRPLGRTIMRVRALGGRQRRAIVGLASVAAVIGLGLVACDWNATMDATDRANDRIDRTEVRLDETQDDLSAALDTVDANRTTLAEAIKTRLTREAERSQAQETYDANALWLQAVQGNLSNANAALEASAGQLEALQACVAGATEALNAASAGDTRGLANAVRGIEGVCAQAGVEL